MSNNRHRWIGVPLLVIGVIVGLVGFRILRSDDIPPSYVVEITKETHWVLPDQLAHVPRFETTTNQWFVDNKKISNLSEYMTDNWEGPNAFVRTYFVFTLDGKANSNTVRLALSDLTSRGICYAGIIDFPPRELSIGHMALVFRIVEVKERDGNSRRCHQGSRPSPL